MLKLELMNLQLANGFLTHFELCLYNEYDET